VVGYSLNSPTVPSTTRRAHTPPLVTLRPPPVSPKLYSRRHLGIQTVSKANILVSYAV